MFKFDFLELLAMAMFNEREALDNELLLELENFSMASKQVRLLLFLGPSLRRQWLEENVLWWSDIWWESRMRSRELKEKEELSIIEERENKLSRSGYIYTSNYKLLNLTEMVDDKAASCGVPDRYLRTYTARPS